MIVIGNSSEFNTYLKLIFICFLMLVVLSFSGFYVSNYSFYIYLFLISILTLVVTPKDMKIDGLLLYVVGNLLMFVFYTYWSSFNGIGYLTGSATDDWNFDIEWGQSYYKNYGINPLYLYDELGELHNSVGYVYFVALNWWLSDLLDGYTTFNTRTINVFFLILVAIISSKIAAHFSGDIGDKKTSLKKCVLYTVFLMPLMNYYSVFVLRETLVILLVLICAYQGLINGKKISSLLIVFFSLFVLWYLRKSTCFVVFVLYIFILTPKEKWKWYIPIFCTPAIVSLFIINSDLISFFMRGVDNYNEMNITRYGDIASKFMSLPFGINIIPRITYAFIVPSINFSEFDKIYASIETYMKVLAFPYLMASLANKNIDIRLKLIFLTFFFVVIFSTVSHRHFTMFVPLGIILVYLQIFSESKISLRSYISWLLVFFFMLIISFASIILFN